MPKTGMGIEHKGMLHAAKILALTAFELLQNPELVEKALEEFQERIKETPYESSLPDDWRPPFEHVKHTYRN